MQFNNTRKTVLTVNIFMKYCIFLESIEYFYKILYIFTKYLIFLQNSEYFSFNIKYFYKILNIF